MATDRNTRGKNALEFGKATMYVISERGLQTESSMHNKAAENRIFLDKAVFSGKKVNFSHTRSVDFNWKELAKSSEQDKKLRILNLNELVVNDKMKTLVSPEKTRYSAGAKSFGKNLDRPNLCCYASEVNMAKQYKHGAENIFITRLSKICDDSMDNFEKSTAKEKPERQKRSKAQNRKDNEIFEKSCLLRSHDVDSLKSEQTFETFEDIKTTGTSEQENDSESSSTFYKDCTFQVEKLEKPGKCYLKRIFYSKGHPHYSKPSNISCLPQIERKLEKCEPAKHSHKVGRNSSSSRETIEENNIHRPRNDKLLPLNINVLKTSETQKHNLKSIVKLPTVVDNRTGQVHLSLQAIAFEQSDYNKWSRRRQQTKLENAKATSFSFPLIAKSSR